MATLVCVVFAIATVTVGIGQVVSTVAASNTELVCGDDVSPATVAAAQEVLRGVNPYTAYNVLRAEQALGCPSLNVTPLRSGVFATRMSAPSQTESDAVARAALASHAPGGILLGFNYPAGSAFAGIAGAKALVLLNTLALLVAGAVVTRAAHEGLRRWVGVSLLAQTGVLLLVGPAHPDGIALALLIIACSSRRMLVGGIAIGLACATKQTAWFVAAPLLVLANREGPRPGLRFAAAAGLSFAAVNLPFAVRDPAAWLSGVLAPQTSPEFTIGSGPIRFFGDPGTALTAVTAGATSMTVLTVLAEMVLAWRGHGGWAEAGVIVASLGLWDGPRSLSFYIALLGAVAVSICARPPMSHGLPSLVVDAGSSSTARCAYRNAQTRQPVTTT